MQLVIFVVTFLCVTKIVVSVPVDEKSGAPGQNMSSHLEDHQMEEKNKKIVLNFYQEAFGDKNPDAADKYIGKEYIQHSPKVADGLQAVKAMMKEAFKGAPKEKINFLRVAADGDLVWLHTKLVRGNKTASLVDIFKLKDGKLVEHWDVYEEVPETSANSHPMF